MPINEYITSVSKTRDRERTAVHLPDGDADKVNETSQFAKLACVRMGRGEEVFAGRIGKYWESLDLAIININFSERRKEENMDDG